MKIYCTGSRGNLGRELVNLGCLPFEADVLDFDAVRQEMLDKAPDVLIHLVSPPVDIVDYNAAITLSVRGTSNVIDNQLYPLVRTIYVSSSHVFDGKKGNYRENAKPNPINDYGYCKLAAEQVARVSGAKIIRLSSCFNKNYQDLRDWKMFYEQGGFDAPIFIRRTYAHSTHIAEGVMAFANRWLDMPPIMNISGTEDLSMYEFVLAIASHYDWDKRLIEPRRKEWKDGQISEKAKRPHKAGLNVSLARKYGIPLYSVYQGIDLL